MFLGKVGVVDLVDGFECQYFGDFMLDDKEFILFFVGCDVCMWFKFLFFGSCFLMELFEYLLVYCEGMDFYVFDVDVVVQFGLLDGVEIEVYFGSWCGVCKNYFLFFMDLYEVFLLIFVFVCYFGLDYFFEGWEVFEVIWCEVKGLLIVIVFCGGKEVGCFSGGKVFVKFEQLFFGVLKQVVVEVQWY